MSVHRAAPLLILNVVILSEAKNLLIIAGRVR
jgi:hypothetical protein